MELVFRERGEGPPLLLIHGLFGSADNLGGIARLLEADFHTISVDLRNHGRSPHSSIMNYSVMAEDVLGVLNCLEIERAHVLGHSMGGKTAMQLALDHPDRVNKLVVADIAPVSYEHHHAIIIEGMRAVADAAPNSRNAAQEILAGFEPEPAILTFLMTNWRRGENGTWGWRVNLDVIEQNYASIAAGNTGGPFEGGVLFLRGSASNYVRAEHREVILHLFPKATVRTIEGAGHWLHAEKSDMVARAVSRFLLA